MALYNC